MSTGTRTYAVAAFGPNSRNAKYRIASRATGKPVDNQVFATADEAQVHAEGMQKAIDARKAREAATPVATQTEKVEAAIAATGATEAQIAYALHLAAKNAAGSIDVTAAHLRTLSRVEVSRIIDSLKSEW